MVPPISVVVDDREADSGVVEALRSLHGIEVAVQRLPLGDYEVAGRFLFERKRLLDLATSLKDGRLLGQACRLAVAPQRSVLILEGTARDLAASRVRREALQGALVSIAVFLGIPLLRAKAPEESARLMVYAARQAHAVAQGPLPRPLPAKRPRGKRKAQLYLLQGLPGVGPARAQRLLEAFGSVEAVLTATAAELAQVPGVGATTVDAIRWAVSEQVGHYEAPEAET